MSYMLKHAVSIGLKQCYGQVMGCRFVKVRQAFKNQDDFQSRHTAEAANEENCQ